MKTLLLIGTIAFLISFVRGAFGFADALLGMPLLVLLLPFAIASPLLALFANTLTLILVSTSFKQISFRDVKGLIIGSIVGIPVGMFFFSFPEWIIKTLLGVVLISFCAFQLYPSKGFKLKSSFAAPIFGFFAGILGGAYNALGPPIVVYGSLRNWSPERFKATVQGYFLPVGLFILIGHAISGLWTTDLFHYYLWGLVPLLFGLLLGNRLHKRLAKHRFDKWIYSLLFINGIVLLIFS